VGLTCAEWLYSFENNKSESGDGVDAALSPTASQCAKLLMLKSQEKREGIHEGN
jgi:hypothetical protein